MKLSTHPRADQAVIGGFLQRKSTTPLCAEQASLRKQITAINKQITDSKEQTQPYSKINAENYQTDGQR